MIREIGGIPKIPEVNLVMCHIQLWLVYLNSILMILPIPMLNPIPIPTLIPKLIPMRNLCVVESLNGVPKNATFTTFKNIFFSPNQEIDSELGHPVD